MTTIQTEKHPHPFSSLVKGKMYFTTGCATFSGGTWGETYALKYSFLPYCANTQSLLTIFETDICIMQKIPVIYLGVNHLISVGDFPIFLYKGSIHLLRDIKLFKLNKSQIDTRWPDDILACKLDILKIKSDNVEYFCKEYDFFRAEK